MRFVKGHGTQNDFIVLPDGADGLDADLVRALCDRRSGIGADGVLAVVREASGFFMDYRNADGTIAETCGNGIRVFARYLVDAGLATGSELVIGTRAGDRRVTVTPDEVVVEMGHPSRLDDAEVRIGETSWKAVGYSMGNPHLVVLDAIGIDALDLSAPPKIDPASAYPDGVNVELVEQVGQRHVRMRVHERGSGETRSCGTGACAVAIAAMDAAGERASYLVDVRGGQLSVDWRENGEVIMAGPAVLVASGEYPFA